MTGLRTDGFWMTASSLAKRLINSSGSNQDQFFASVKREDRRNVPEANLTEGLPMTTSRQWLFSATTGGLGGLIHYTYVEFARDIEVTPMGAQFASTLAM